MEPIVCAMCFDALPTLESALVHQEDRHNNDRSFRCCHCRLMFPHRQQRDRHQSSCSGSPQVAEVHRRDFDGLCNLCDLEFRTSSELRDHQMHDHRGFKCPKCERLFRTKIEMQEHRGGRHCSGKKQ